MNRRIILSGFGGQGVLSLGKNLAEAGLEEGREVSWVPAYGPEMRGGTANCSVIISDNRIGSPLIEHPTELIVMNRPSLIKFEPLVKTGGLVFVDSSTISDKVQREDLHAFYIPCDSIAKELGNGKAANIVMLGAFVKATGIVKLETIEHIMHEIFTGAKARFIPVNLEALKRGADCVTHTPLSY